MSLESEEDLLQRHRKEMKDLQVKAAAMKKSAPVSDKKRRKEVLAEIEKLEKELTDRHSAELSSSRNTSADDTFTERTEENSSPSEQEHTANHRNGIRNDPTNVLTNGDSRYGMKDEEGESTASGSKLTRAQRRRNVKQSKLDERLAALKLVAGKPFEVSARTTEKIKLKKILDDLKLQLVEMRSDGNCMYHSLSYQLQLNGRDLSVQELRQQTADHMSSKPEDFLPFLAHHETGDPLTAQEFEEYCEDIAKTNAWGSQVELRALATILNWPILVLQAEGPEVRIGDEYSSEDKPPLVIVYHRHVLSLGEHYNSVMPVE
ncbi:hypothetical protein RvY_13784 [Ramazzottius varieornatus]|uniref:OTU domain-containing protein n=1 Tax=Ramazzottius varieornatus TaxID=947166 RepID=A0A1D1VWI0_RAMVA|nr:hypothetical protein RvY_13784 [Ramazzottius varieornatus]